MTVNKFYVVGRETSGGAVFLQTDMMVGGMLTEYWGELESADRYLMFEDAEKAAENAPRQHESDEPATVWRVEVTVTKETT